MVHALVGSSKGSQVSPSCGLRVIPNKLIWVSSLSPQDWVRLQKGLAPPHWKRTNPSGDWDGGYERTAFFLDWIEQTYGDHFVRRLNESMIDKYEPHIWEDLTGLSVEELWRVYVKAHCEDAGTDKK